MNSILSIHSQKSNLVAKVFTLTNFSLPSTLLLYFTVIEDEVDTTLQKLGEYKGVQYSLDYFGTDFISTDSPFTNANMGSYKSVDINNYAVINLYPLFNVTVEPRAVTIAFWFKLTSTTGFGSVKFPFRVGNDFSTSISPELTYNSSGQLTNFFVYCGTTSGARISNTNNALLNNWVHFAVVFQHNTVAKMYINNVVYNSSNGTNTFNSNFTPQTGRIPFGGTASPIGNVADIRIYKEALTSTQIQNIYQWNGAANTQPTY